MVDSAEIENLPLGDRLKKADYLARELSEHLTQAYLPKLTELRAATKIYDAEEVSDQQILDHTLAVLKGRGIHCRSVRQTPPVPGQHHGRNEPAAVYR